MKKIDPKAFYDFKAAAANLQITKLTKKDIDQLKQQLDAIIKSK